MDFITPKPPGEDPADDWKKDQPNGHEVKPWLPEDTLQELHFGQPLTIPLAQAIANRFTELDFSPDAILDKTGFGFLFIAQQNCLMIKRQPHPAGGYAVTAHRFLERKKK